MQQVRACELSVLHFLVGYTLVTQRHVHPLRAPVALRIVGALAEGAIIEQGSNANGEYVRFADGTQVCWLKQTQQGIAVNQAAGIMYRSATIQWTFPAQFVGLMNYLSFHSGSAFGMITYTNVPNYTLGVLCHTTQITANTLLWFAIGRWQA